METLESKEIICPKPNGEIERLTSVDWSPKGNKLALASERFFPNPLVNKPASSDHGIWVVNIDGSNAKRLTEDDEISPEWLPDGTEIAFTGRDGFAWKIFIMGSDEDNSIKLLTHPFSTKITISLVVQAKIAALSMSLAYPISILWANQRHVLL